jgi:hypothetical protein
VHRASAIIFDKHLTAELARWREVVKSTRIKAE